MLLWWEVMGELNFDEVLQQGTDQRAKNFP